MQVLKRNPLPHSTLIWLMLLAALWACLGEQTLGLKTASGQIYGLQPASWESTPLQAAPRLGLRALEGESVSAPPVGVKGGVAAGEIKILQGATPDANELRAGQGLAEQFGYHVHVAHQPTASQLGVQGQRTADLTVKGVGQVDVYTPNSTNPTSITRAIEGKNTQATAVLVQTSIADADMATVAARTWGKPTAQNIQTIFFQRPDGSIVRFHRPTGG